MNPKFKQQSRPLPPGSQKEVTPRRKPAVFFHHYQVINQTLSGQPIHDWQAAAAKWAKNIKVAINTTPGKLHTDDNKAYTSPL